MSSHVFTIFGRTIFSTIRRLDCGNTRPYSRHILCYAYTHGKCTEGANCKRYHGPQTIAMQKKRLADEKRMLEKRARAKERSKAKGAAAAAVGGDANKAPPPVKPGQG